jgi:hypothetical protein
MTIRQITGIPTLLLLMTSIAPTAGATQGPVDHSIYGRLLKAHVIEGRVDYSGFKLDEGEKNGNSI